MSQYGGGINQGTTPGVIKTSRQEQTIDVTNSSTSFVTLLTDSFTTGPGSNRLKIWISYAVSNTAVGTNLAIFRITVDGTPQRGGASDTIGATAQQSGSIIVDVPVGPGPHTIVLQWRVSSGTAQIRAVTAPDLEHANMIIMETTV